MDLSEAVYNTLLDCELAGINLSREGDNLRFSGPPGRLTDSLRERIKKNKLLLLEAVSLPSGSSLLTYQQLRYARLMRDGAVGSSYVNSVFATIPENLTQQEIIRRLKKAASIHDALRMEVRNDLGFWTSYTHSSINPVINYVSVSKTDLTDQLLQELADKQFNFHEYPLWDVTFLEDRGIVHSIIISLHHLISDGWSISLFVDFLLSREEKEFKTDCSLSEFCSFERQQLVSGALSKQLAYWREELETCEDVIRNSTWRNFSSEPKPKAFRDIISKKNVTQLKDLARGHGVSLYSLFLSHFVEVWFSNFTDEKSTLISIPIALRSNYKYKYTFGPLITYGWIPIFSFEGLPITEIYKSLNQKVINLIEFSLLPLPVAIYDFNSRLNTELSETHLLCFNYLPSTSRFGNNEPQEHFDAQLISSPGDYSLKMYINEIPEGLELKCYSKGKIVPFQFTAEFLESLSGGDKHP
jgi:hypothetical protein